MDLEQRLSEFKTRYRHASLPDEVRQPYEQILSFVDAGFSAETITTFAGELAGQLECKLDVFFPVLDAETEIDPEELVNQQQYDDLMESLRAFEQLEGDVEEAILEHIPGKGDETLCLFPAPFLLSEEENPDPGVLGEIISNLLGNFIHPTMLLRNPPHRPSENLFDRVVVAGSTLHNILRLIRCTAGLCPENTTLHVSAVADDRFTESMKNLFQESEEFDLDKNESKLDDTLKQGMRRKLRQAHTRLVEDHDISVEFEIHDGTIESVTEKSPYFQSKPTLLSIPFHFSGGGYDTSSLRPLFERYTTTEILTI